MLVACWDSHRRPNAAPEETPDATVALFDAGEARTDAQPDAAGSGDVRHDGGVVDSSVIDGGDAAVELPSCLAGSAGVFVGDFGESYLGTNPMDPSLLLGVREIVGDVVLSPARYAYGEALRCLERVRGNLTIFVPNGHVLSDVHALENLREVSGNLDVAAWSAGDLTDVRFLQSLESVGGVLSVGMRRMESLAGLERLRHVGGDLQLFSSQRLGDLLPLSHLETVEGYLAIDGGRFQDLSGLGALTTLGTLEISRGLLSSLSGLSSDLHLSSGLALSALHNLTSLDGLPRGSALPQHVSLISLPNLTSVEALSTSTRLADLTLERLPRLTELPVFRDVHALDALLVTDVPLSSLEAFTNVETLRYTLLLDRTGVTTLADLTQLTTLGSLHVTSSPLRTIGLNAVTELESLRLRDTQLSTLDGLHALTLVLSDVEISDNPLLTEIPGLSALQYVGHLILTNSGALASLQGLSALRGVRDLLMVENLDALTHLDDLSALESAGRVHVAGNALLASLGSLSNLDFYGRSIVLYQNPRIALCEAVAVAEAQRSVCSCPELSAPCTPSCDTASVDPACNNCDTLSACQCTGTCNCTGNDNRVLDCEAQR